MQKEKLIETVTEFETKYDLSNIVSVTLKNDNATDLEHFSALGTLQKHFSSRISQIKLEFTALTRALREHAYNSNREGQG